MESKGNSPVILTTSQLLTTGVDAPTCKNIVIARVINSMIEFKQIIGRGTRVRDDYDKYYFTILDYTGSATKLFADPDFDGDPVVTTEEQIDDLGNILRGSQEVVQSTDNDDIAYVDDQDIRIGQEFVTFTDGQKKVRSSRKKYYVDGGRVEIIGDQVYELDADDNRLRMVRLTEYTAGKVRGLYPNAAALRGQWANPKQRKDIIDYLENRGITFDTLMAATQQPDADPFDLLCSIAFSTPMRTRRDISSSTIQLFLGMPLF